MKMAPVRVVCCAEVTDPRWRWVASYFSEAEVGFEFVRCQPRKIDRVLKVFSLARLLGCLEAVRMVRRSGAQILVTHGPTLAAWCMLFARLLGVKPLILAHGFNFVALPRSVKRTIFKFAFSRVERFVVFSRVEREIYSKTFNVPIERFDFVYWGVQVPSVDAPDQALEAGDYVAAIGGNARDYWTLIKVAQELSQVRFVLVVRPENLAGLELPPNVSAHTNIPFGKAMNILLHSRFLALPLIPGDVPCGHVTLVAAMQLGKAIVVTNSLGVSDYTRDGENAITVEPGSKCGLVAAIQRLWDDRDLCERLAKNGQRFAADQCTEARIAEQFRTFVLSRSAN
jgi:glycosyltransferase involved in cell wall biosynthesis